MGAEDPCPFEKAPQSGKHLAMGGRAAAIGYELGPEVGEVLPRDLVQGAVAQPLEAAADVPLIGAVGMGRVDLGGQEGRKDFRPGVRGGERFSLGLWGKDLRLSGEGLG